MKQPQIDIKGSLDGEPIKKCVWLAFARSAVTIGIGVTLGMLWYDIIKHII